MFWLSRCSITMIGRFEKVRKTVNWAFVRGITRDKYIQELRFGASENQKFMEWKKRGERERVLFGKSRYNLAKVNSKLK